MSNVYWYLAPLVAVVSLVYSATRHEEWPVIVYRAVRLSVMILGLMGLIVLGLWAIQLAL